MIKTPAQAINVQTVTDGINWRVTSGRENKFDTCRFTESVMVVEGC